MKPVYYRPFKLAVAALLMAASALYLLTSDGWSGLNNVLGVAAGIGAVAAGACGLDPRPALAVQGHSLFVRTTWRRLIVPLADILSASVETRMVRLHGVIPIGRREVLVIRVQGGVIGSRKFTLPAGTLALPAGGLRQVCATLNTLRRSAPSISEISAPRSSAPDEDSGTGFDPDAAIARHLARKAAASEPPAPEPDGPVSAAVRLPGPARPTFGRRVA